MSVSRFRSTYRCLSTNGWRPIGREQPISLLISSRPYSSNTDPLLTIPKKDSTVTSTPNKPLSPPEHREMWELMSEIFVPTGNVAELMTRYHIKARELLAQKESKQLLDKRFRQLKQRKGLYDNPEDLYDKPKTKTRSMYDVLAESDAKDTVQQDNAPSSLYEQLAQDDQFAQRNSSVEKEEKKPKKNLIDEDGLITTFFDDPKLSSTTLYWPSGTLSFLKSDFERILPFPVNPTSRNISSDADYFSDSLERSLASFASAEDSWKELITPDVARDMSSFTLARARDPQTLIRWIGYYLKFPTRLSAALFFRLSLTAEICGLRPKFSFVPNFPSPTAPSIFLPETVNPPILSEVPGVTRDMCVLIKGLPPRYSPSSMAKWLWDYDLFSDESKAIVKLSGNQPFDSESIWLLRFNNNIEPKRLRSMFHRRCWPNTDRLADVEILD